MTDETNIPSASAPKTTRKPRNIKTNSNESAEATTSTSTRSKPTLKATKKTSASTKTPAKKTKTVENDKTKAKVERKSPARPKAKALASQNNQNDNNVSNNDASIDVHLMQEGVEGTESIESKPAPKRVRKPRTTKQGNDVTAPKAQKNETAPDKDNAEPSPKSEGASKKVTPKKPRRTSKKIIQDDENISLSSTEVSTVDTESNNIEDTENDDTASSKSRRGRRGGRGKRGKKRTTKPVDESVDLPVNSVSKLAHATSVAEGKPGRARASAAKKSTTASSKRRNMFISVVSGEQVEVALTEEGALHEYYLEMLHQMKTKGNIYKGVVHNVDTNLQAAFINYGAGKNGFLQIDEIHPEYYQNHHEPSKGKKYPPIQQVIKPGQEILVQVLKEPTGSKGAFLTTWLSLAGRFLVLTPGQEQIGISRKVDSEEERARLREMMSGIEPGAGLGVIVRTVSVGTSKTTLKNDLQYLKRVWREIRKRGVSESAPLLVYQEPKLAERAIRDYLTDDVHEVWVDNAEMAESLREIVSLLFPRKKDLVRVHTDVRQTLWERFAVQRQLEQIYSREVVLPSGGRLVFDQTEALMAIDINSGKISGKGNFASMALKTNLEAAEAIARHLRLRDIGGQIVIDFIEMRDKNHVREVEKTLRAAMKNDRARHDLGRMSSFGLLEIVRQRTASSALAITMEPCPHCRGTGMRRNLEWQSLQSLREMMRQGRATQGEHFVFEASPELALYLLNRKRQRISEIEEQLNKQIEVRLRA